MVTSAGPYEPGGQVTYEITVTNEGTLDASNVVVSDMLPTGLNFVSGTNFMGSGPYTLTIASLPAGGAPIVLTLVADIDANFQGTNLTNVAQITADNGGDIDSTPNNNMGMEDDQDEVSITVDQTFDLALRKTLSGVPTAINPGDDVTFTITVINQGSLDAYNVEITDYIPTGFILDTTNPANSDWILSSSVATANTGSTVLTPNSQVNFSITLTVDNSFQGNSLINVAEISSADDDLDGTLSLIHI